MLLSQYGAVPDGIEYLETQDVALHKAIVEIFIGQPLTGTKILTIRFQTGDQAYWLEWHLLTHWMTERSAGESQQALGFALASSPD